MRKFLIFILLVPVYTGLKAQKEENILPINPDFLEYWKTMSQSPVSSDGKPLGYIPMFYSLKDIYESEDDGLMLKSTATSVLPATYDLRNENRVTSPKNQGGGNAGGNCWAFATMGSLESQWMTRGLGTFDLSEQNMAACHGWAWKYGQGGNEKLSLSYLARLLGPVADTTDPYNTRKTTCAGSLPVAAYSPEARWIIKSRYLTKSTIMDYGAVTTNIYWESQYYNSEDYTFYYGGTKPANHQILLVGWDDNKVTKGGTGAWIAKNSWGETFGEKGFFYISYKDTKILNPASFYPTRWKAGSVEKVYTYSELGVVSFIGFNWDTASVLVRFYASKSQFLRRVGTFIARTGGTVDITIYDDKDGEVLSNQLAHFTSKPVYTVGFYVFDVPTFIKGDFYIKVKYSLPGNPDPIPVECRVKDPADTSKYMAFPVIERSGKQWVMSRGKWQPLGDDIKGLNFDLAVYAYAESATGPKAVMELSKDEVCPNSTMVFTDNSKGTINSYKWYFGSDAVPSTATGKGPHTVTINSDASRGVHYASLVVSGPAGTDSITAEYRVENRIVMNIAIPSFARINDSVKLTAIGDADNYTWSPTAELDRSIGRTVTLVAQKEGRHRLIVSATQGDCSTSGIVEIDVHKPPVNDNMCDAIELKTGDNGPFYNSFASIQKKEPTPKDTGCNKPLSWCSEGGLQNSVWFKYTFKDKGVVTFDTRGIDTQIAIYNSTSCSTLKSTDLVAANDDYHASEPFPAAASLVNDTPGKTYWVQIDGSNWGDSGKFYINVSEGALALKKANIEEITLNVVPNPNNGISVLKYSSLIIGSLDVKVYDLTGKIYLSKQVRKDNYNIDIPLDLSSVQKGIYFINVRAENSVKTVKCIVQ